MLTSNHKRSNQLENKGIMPFDDNGVESTKFGGSGIAKEDFENQTAYSDIESKFTQKKKNVKTGRKIYKEDQIDPSYLEDQFIDNRD